MTTLGVKAKAQLVRAWLAYGPPGQEEAYRRGMARRALVISARRAELAIIVEETAWQSTERLARVHRVDISDRALRETDLYEANNAKGPPPPKIVYTKYVKDGFEVEQWDVAQLWYEWQPISVAWDAEKSAHYVDADGNPHTVFIRYGRPASCPHCGAKA